MKKSLKYPLITFFLIISFSQKSSAQVTLLDPKLDVDTIAITHTTGASAITHTITVVTKQFFSSGFNTCKRDTTSFIKRYRTND